MLPMEFPKHPASLMFSSLNMLNAFEQSLPKCSLSLLLFEFWGLLLVWGKQRGFRHFIFQKITVKLHFVVERMRLLPQRHTICVTMFLCPILITQSENSDEYKEVSNRRLTDQIAEKAKQTVVDIGEVMKSQQSVLECDGKKFVFLGLFEPTDDLGRYTFLIYFSSI